MCRVGPAWALAAIRGEALASLREAFQLRVLDGLTTTEAAQIVGVADVTMKAQVSRARAELRRMMRLAHHLEL
jgi:DNA-directed RNA polymerase specialized sigma24 family protein